MDFTFELTILSFIFVEMAVDFHTVYKIAMSYLASLTLASMSSSLPAVAKIIDKILKPVLIIIVAFTISFGIYTNFYIFEMIQPMTIVAGCLLPYIGYFLGGFAAFLCCRSWTHIKTIAIETGIQNTSIAFLILYLSLPPPDNQLATVGPASSVIMTPLPLFCAVFVYIIYHRYVNKRTITKKNCDQINTENGNI